MPRDVIDIANFTALFYDADDLTESRRSKMCRCLGQSDSDCRLYGMAVCHGDFEVAGRAALFILHVIGNMLLRKHDVANKDILHHLLPIKQCKCGICMFKESIVN